MSQGCRNQFLADPCIATEVHHLRGIWNSRMRASGIPLRFEPIVEVALNLGIDLVAEIDVDTLRRILGIELLRDFTVDVRASTVVLHQDHVPEAGGNRFLADSLED